MPYKVLLIAANNGLQLAEQEKVEISNLIALYGKPCLEEVALAERSLDEIIAKLGAIDNISIIHFSGHANGEKLWAGAGEAGDGDGFATMLKRQKNLRLVFLNGCSTDGMVEELLNAGVKAVIATRKEIGDQLAKQFSLVFWNRLIAGDSLKEAYEFAVASVQFRAKFEHQQPIVLVSRGGKRGLVLKEKDRKLPWSLYVLNGKKRILKWRPAKDCKRWFWWLGGVLGMILVGLLIYYFPNKRDDPKPIILNPILEWQLQKEQFGKVRVGDTIRNELYIRNREDSLEFDRADLKIRSITSSLASLRSFGMTLKAGKDTTIVIEVIADKFVEKQKDTIILNSNAKPENTMVVYAFEMEKVGDESTKEETEDSIHFITKYFCQDIPNREVSYVYDGKTYRSSRENSTVSIEIPKELLGKTHRFSFGSAGSDYIRIRRELCLGVPTSLLE